MEQEKINFSVVRDFSELFNTTVKFFNKNFRHFFQSVIFIAGPLVLITSIAMAFYQYTILSAPQISRVGFGNSVYTDMLFQRFGWGFAVYIFFSILSNLVLVTTAYSYMIVYTTSGPKNFSVADVRKAVWQNMGKTVRGFFAMILLLFGVFFGIGILGAIVGGIGLTILAIFIIIAALILSPPFVWQISTFYLVKMKDDLSSFDALAKTREVMRGNFFSTWLYMVATFVALIIISTVFSIPQLICQIFFRVGQVEGSYTALTIGITMVTQFFIILIYSIFYFMCGLHYYSLAEKKDGTSLIDRINEIGNTPAPDVEQHY